MYDHNCSLSSDSPKICLVGPIVQYIWRVSVNLCRKSLLRIPSGNELVKYWPQHQYLHVLFLEAPSRHVGGCQRNIICIVLGEGILLLSPSPKQNEFMLIKSYSTPGHLFKLWGFLSVFFFFLFCVFCLFVFPSEVKGGKFLFALLRKCQILIKCNVLLMYVSSGFLMKFTRSWQFDNFTDFLLGLPMDFIFSVLHVSGYLRCLLLSRKFMKRNVPSTSLREREIIHNTRHM